MVNGNPILSIGPDINHGAFEPTFDEVQQKRNWATLVSQVERWNVLRSYPVIRSNCVLANDERQLNQRYARS
jgi:hypothetical protein